MPGLPRDDGGRDAYGDIVDPSRADARLKQVLERIDTAACLGDPGQGVGVQHGRRRAERHDAAGEPHPLQALFRVVERRRMLSRECGRILRCPAVARTGVAHDAGELRNIGGIEYLRGALERVAVERDARAIGVDVDFDDDA